MILDSSAVVAVLRGEPEASAISKEIELANSKHISTVSCVEAAVVIESAGMRSHAGASMIFFVFRELRLSL